MLIKDQDTIKSYLTATAGSGVKWASIKPFIIEAEIKYLVPAIGSELYLLIDEAYEINSLQPAETALLPYLQAPVAKLAVYLYSFQADVILGDAGIQRMESGNVKSAYKYQLLSLRDSLVDSGFEAIERLLDYLEKNASDFSAWQDSDARRAANELLIRSGRELKLYYSALRQPQRTYAALISMLHTIEDLTVAPVLGDIYVELKASDQDGSATLFESTVIKTLKKSLAHLAISKGLLQLDIRMDDSGLSQLNATHTGPNRGEDSNRAQASGKTTQALSQQCEDIGLSYLNAAVRYLSTNASPSVFPTWYAKLQAEALACPPPKDRNPYLNGAFSF